MIPLDMSRDKASATSSWLRPTSGPLELNDRQGSSCTGNSVTRIWLLITPTSSSRNGKARPESTDAASAVDAAAVPESERHARADVHERSKDRTSPTRRPIRPHRGCVRGACRRKADRIDEVPGADWPSAVVMDRPGNRSRSLVHDDLRHDAASPATDRRETGGNAADDGHDPRRQCPLGVGARSWPGVGRCLYVPALQGPGSGHAPWRAGRSSSAGSPRGSVRLLSSPPAECSRATLSSLASRSVPPFSPSLPVSLSGSEWVGRACALSSTRSAAWAIRRVSRLISRPVDDPAAAVNGWIEGLRSLRPSKAEWGKVGGLGLANWVTDIGVLAMSIVALGGAVPWRSLLLVYGLATLIGSLGITPGGLGLVEGTLCLGLVSTGLPAALALAAVLLYRLVSFWLVMATGWLVLLWLRLERLPRVVSITASVAQ